MLKHYLIAYDIVEAKRRRHVAKEVYALSLGGQKSALESVLDEYRADRVSEMLYSKIKPEEDRVNIIGVKPRAILLGRATQLTYDDGVILI